MITLILGDNWYEADRAVKQLTTHANGEVVRRDGGELTIEQLSELIAGLTLFADHKLVIISDLSSNRFVWERLADWATQVPDTTHLVLIEPHIDRRTKTAKILQAIADIKEFTAINAKDNAAATAWIKAEAKQRGVRLDHGQTQLLFERCLVPSGRPGQLVLDHGIVINILDSLSPIENVSDDTLDALVPADSQQNIFKLFELAMNSDKVRIGQALTRLSMTESPQAIMAIVAGQVYQLAALVYAHQPVQEVASAIGAHPFVMQKLAASARRISKKQLRNIIEACAEADSRLKTASGDPWLIVWQLLMKIGV